LAPSITNRRASPTRGGATALNTVHLITAIEPLSPSAKVVIDLATGAFQEYEQLHIQSLEDF
jgi:hypothetical protein